MIGWARIPMSSATAIAAGLTSASKGQILTHLAFLIGYQDGCQTVMLGPRRDDMCCLSGLKGHENRGGLKCNRNERERENINMYFLFR